MMLDLIGLRIQEVVVLEIPNHLLMGVRNIIGNLILMKDVNQAIDL